MHTQCTLVSHRVGIVALAFRLLLSCLHPRGPSESKTFILLSHRPTFSLQFLQRSSRRHSTQSVHLRFSAVFLNRSEGNSNLQRKQNSQSRVGRDTHGEDQSPSPRKEKRLRVPCQPIHVGRLPLAALAKTFLQVALLGLKRRNPLVEETQRLLTPYRQRVPALHLPTCLPPSTHLMMVV